MPGAGLLRTGVVAEFQNPLIRFPDNPQLATAVVRGDHQDSIERVDPACSLALTGFLSGFDIGSELE